MFLNFFKFKLPAASGPCPDSLFSILLCKGIVKDFFQILDAGRRPQVAGRRDIIDVAVGAGQRAARCGNPVKCFVAKSLFTGRESSPAAIYSSFIVRRSSICWHSMSKKIIY